ncbi:helix-turn-helix domain-containing protein [Embleya sp. NPDC059259]|uniref:MmyB family transcriptional regulator n=1 Tax=unclassified Embleya TaxID=2699296 RepID=UPI0036B705C6
MPPRIRPEEVGLAPGPRRRVPGLRRDEVAVPAGASVEYYIELERGAGSQPSDRMLAALARALRLSRDERDHLYRLANRSIPHQGGATSHVHSALLDLLTRIDGTPAMVSTDPHTVLVQNPLAIAMLGDLSAHRGRAASFVYRWFTDPASRQIYPQEDLGPQARSFVEGFEFRGEPRAGLGEGTRCQPVATSSKRPSRVRRHRQPLHHPEQEQRRLVDLGRERPAGDDRQRALVRLGDGFLENRCAVPAIAGAAGAAGSTTLAYTATDAPSATPRDNATDVQTASTTPALLSGPT